MRSDTVLRRKTAASKEWHEARVMSPRRALRLALCRTAEVGLSLPLAVSGVERFRTDHGSLMAMLDESGLMVCVEAPGQVRGVMVLDLQILTALIETQTIGYIISRSAQMRPTTRTDAAISMPLVDGTLREFEAELARQEDASWTKGFRFASWVEEKRALGVALTATTFETFHLTLDIGDGDRKGEVLLALPRPDPVFQPAPESKVDAQDAGLGRGLMEAKAKLDAVLLRRAMSLEEVGQLRVGDVLMIPPRALAEVQLEGVGRQVVASGSLGQINGNRALRLTALGAPNSAEQAPEGEASEQVSVDLADAGLIEQKKKPRMARPADVPMAATEIPLLGDGAEEGASLTQDTEALLSELGLDLLEEHEQGLYPAPALQS
ncbi:FliM/FliN family flagellar motor C-terminal domain-containing protein [Thalassovita taeanensis]|uniref:Type III flagellar switch regulator (C-ring) FliN C-term n=1 Tax=Thalassovita taeanensis TaxID=657014 RepID=A0A1H9KM87_9RHOB|nr:FliM/FliN family flagellar motor C-terminal domain-containing protein [Thalassovita taeanensis]SER00270.1 Type III flagellar switch regulator (C-ring) FliN C-term [Thalassovita taeanensis]